MRQAACQSSLQVGSELMQLMNHVASAATMRRSHKEIANALVPMNDCRDPLVEKNRSQLLLVARIAPATAGMTTGIVALGGQELFGVSHQDGFAKGVGFHGGHKARSQDRNGLIGRC
jgi:hypothetical protein